MNLRIFGIVEESIVDGPGIRFTVFTQGCPHNCFGCHNPESHDFNKGVLVPVEVILEKIKKNPLIDGVTFSGGEPFMQIEPIIYLCREIKKLGLSVIIYTGFLWEQLIEDEKCKELLKYVDIIIDGKFQMEKRNLSLKFTGSENQRIIDVKCSMENNSCVEMDSSSYR